ncbi:MAG: ATPase [Bacteroidetes bacterium B1(2017)]|nr:MAG: ATPase [Bacteroidetes bacterium B1(2017)]
MKNSIIFDFTVDKSTNTVFVTREFNAEQSLVWDAFTKQEILDQWWAPKPWTARTKQMNFESGGHRFYAMVSPEGEEHWSLEEYTSVSPITNYQIRSSFADKDKNVNTEFPTTEWDLNFSELDGVTTVNISIKHHSLEALEMHIKMGFQGGFTMTLNYLEQLFDFLKTK